MVVFTIAGAILVLLEVAAALLKDKDDPKFLPLGGSQSSQMGIIFGLAFAIHELLGALR